MPVPGTLLLLFGGGPGGGAPSPTYTLSLWQSLILVERCDLWEPTRTAGTNGDMGVAVYRKKWANVPCYQVRKVSVTQTENFGRTEQDNEFTRDTWWFHEAQEVNDTWAIVMKAVDREGVNHPDFDRAWLAAGDSRIQIDAILDEGHREIESVAQPVLPNGVS